MPTLSTFMRTLLETPSQRRARLLREVMAEVDLYAGLHTGRKQMPDKVSAADVVSARSRVAGVVAELIRKTEP